VTYAHQRLATMQTLYAPYVLDGGIISALLGLMRGKKITEREADAALSSYRAFPSSGTTCSRCGPASREPPR
jgi:hypothetical protein